MEPPTLLLLLILLLPFALAASLCCTGPIPASQLPPRTSYALRHSVTDGHDSSGWFRDLPAAQSAARRAVLGPAQAAVRTHSQRRYSRIISCFLCNMLAHTALFQSCTRGWWRPICSAGVSSQFGTFLTAVHSTALSHHTPSVELTLSSALTPCQLSTPT